ncbi:PepSY-like domain-containing protein [Pontibacter russatus]|uniref:PepSY-like domain-containing protein n=1 Tax=Pontibacter russatus TaxID=2694929 RepID=UPI00137A9CF0|nr:PepSY-like domain-containing protein [Pontibacter russatus]
MKTILLAVLFSGSAALAANAQDIKAADVPQAVTSALAQKYADPKGLDWEMDGANYEAEFDVNRTDHTVLIAPSGEIVMAKSDMMQSELPQPVRNAIDQKYKGMPVDDVEQVEKGGETYYQVELDENGTDRKLVFTADGQEVTEPAYWD